MSIWSRYINILKKIFVLNNIKRGIGLTQVKIGYQVEYIDNSCNFVFIREILEYLFKSSG